MAAGRAFTGSLAAHLGGLALFVHALEPPRAAATDRVRVPATTRRATAAPPEREPIVVSILDEVPVTAAGNERSFRGGPSGHVVTAAESIASAAPARPAEPGAGMVEPSSGRGPPNAGAGLMTMRRPELQLGAGELSAIAGQGELPSPVHRSGRVDNAPGGGAVIRDRVATLNIERDGTVHVHDKPFIDIHLKLPVLPDIRKDLRDIGVQLHDWYVDPYAGERYGRTIDLPQHLQAVPGQCDTYGDAMCDDPMAPEARVMRNETSGDSTTEVAAGNLDITGWLMQKLHVGDAYASRKLALLDATRDERVERGTAFRAEQLAKSAGMMRDTLARLVATSPAELHRALFELWDGCAEGSDAVGQAGERARAQVIGWIRAHLPAGGPGAFSVDEIAGLDAHRGSTQHFAPYGP